MFTSLSLASQREIERLHDMTLELLENKGILLYSEEARHYFKHHGARVDGEIVYIPSTMIMEALTAAPSTFTLRARNREHDLRFAPGKGPIYGPTVGVVYVADEEQGRRPVEVEDLHNFLMLSHTSKWCNFSCAGLVYPASLKGTQGLLTQMYNALVLSDKVPLGLTQDGYVSAKSIEMASIATEMRESYYTLGICNSFSPMAWDNKMLSSIIAYAKANQPILLTSCSMMGLTSPMGIDETVVLNNAEILAALTLAQLIRPGLPVIYGVTSASVDMRYMGFTLGSPEYAQISVIGGQLAKKYRLPYRSGGALTDAKIVDAQAGAESMMSLCVSRSTGINVILNAFGAMESFLSISYEKWIMDEESIGRIEYMLDTPAPASNETVDIIGEIGANGSYLYHESTFANYKDLLFVPPLASRESYDVWSEKGEALTNKARDLCQMRLEEYEQPSFSHMNDIKLRSIIE